MKKYKTEDLLNQLQADVKQLELAAQHLQLTDPVKLSYPPEEGKWSVAQVLEHLNMYSRHYLPLIEKSMVHIPQQVNAWFIPGFFGNYFTRSMMPKNVYEVRNKMKAMKAYRPERGINVEAVFREFHEHQQKLLQLMETAKKRNLEEIRIPTTLTSLIKLKLGDLFRFMVAHEQRHMIQARNAMKSFGVATDKFPVILEAARL